MALSEKDELVRSFLSIIGVNIIKKRGQMSQGVLSEKAGVSRSTIEKIELGKNIKVDMLLKIALGLGTHPGRLFFTDKEQAVESERIKRIEERLDRLEKKGD